MRGSIRSFLKVLDGGNSNDALTYDFEDGETVTKAVTVQSLAREIELDMRDCELATNNVVHCQAELEKANTLLERTVARLQGNRKALDDLIHERVPQCRKLLAPS